MINSLLNYEIRIYPVGDDRDQLTINNITFDLNLGDKYMLSSMNVHYDVFMPETTFATVTLLDIAADVSNTNTSTVGRDIKRGDIVQIVEQTADTAQIIFLGVIDQVLTTFNLTTQSITLIIPSPLRQLSKQQAIRTVKDAGSYSTDNFTQWVIFQQTTIQAMMDIMMEGTIFQYVYNNKITGNKPYKFVEATGTLKGKFSLSSPSWVWVQPTTLKHEAIKTVIYPYQYLMYVDQEGTLILSPLSTRNIADSAYDFSIQTENNTDEEFLLYGSTTGNTTTPILQIDTYQGLTANRYLSSLINAGAQFDNLISVQDISGTGRSSDNGNVQTSRQIFSRQQDLLLTGYYTNQIVDGHSINDQMLTDPTLMNLYVRSSNPYIQSTNSKAGQIQTQSGQQLLNGVLQLFGGRALSESLTNDTIIAVTSERSFTAGKPLPLAQMISIDTAGRLDEEGVNSFLCRSVDLSYQENDTGGWDANLTLGAVKPYTSIFMWDE